MLASPEEKHQRDCYWGQARIQDMLHKIDVDQKILFLCGFLDTMSLGEMRLLVEPLNKLFTRNLQTISCPFQTKILDCQIHKPSLAERTG